MIGRVGIAILAGLLVVSCRLSPPEKIPETCFVGLLTTDGEVCQTMRDGRDDIYSFFHDMNGYTIGEQVCVCGTPSLMTRCKVGKPLDVEHLGRECPGLPSAY